MGVRGQPPLKPMEVNMNHEKILMRDLCDTIMQNHALSDETIENDIAKFRNGLELEQRKQFNHILDKINTEDSDFTYETFNAGVTFAMLSKDL